MNGQHSNEQGGQGGQESHLSFLFNAAANGQNHLMGYSGGAGAGAGAMGGAPGLRYGDASLEEQILQRASALRAEALMQQQQQHQQRQHQLSAALAAFQQQQLSALGLNPNIAALMEARGAQDQEALLGRAAALRELGIGGAGAGGAGAGMQGGGGMERLQQLELGRLEEIERRRQQLAALANLSGGARPSEIPPGSEQIGQDSVKSSTEPPPPKEAHRDSTASAEKSKDDLRKTPGTVIVPCRARGMPMDHNFKTAYFVISEDAKHGEDLVCSYFACRNGGVKFRYCAHCMAPVAKRNFCRRHDHGMSAKGGDGEAQDEDDASMDQSDTLSHKEEPDEAASLHKEKAVAKDDLRVASAKAAAKSPLARDMAGSSLDVLSKAATSSFLLQAGTGKRKMPTSFEEQKEGEGEDMQDPAEQAGEAGPVSISKKRRSLWSALLIKRPRTKDPRHLSSWLNEVLTVSDFETPIDQPEPAEPAAAAAVSSDSSGERAAVAIAAAAAVSEKAKKEPEERPLKEPQATTPKEKKTGEKEKKKRKVEPKSSEEGSSAKAKKEEKEKKKSSQKKHSEGSEKKSSKKAAAAKDGKEKDKDGKEKEGKDSKESPSSKKESEDGFVGSFADWRDRKKEKALSKKGGGSLRK